MNTDDIIDYPSRRIYLGFIACVAEIARNLDNAPLDSPAGFLAALEDALDQHHAQNGPLLSPDEKEGIERLTELFSEWVLHGDSDS